MGLLATGESGRRDVLEGYIREVEEVEVSGDVI